MISNAWDKGSIKDNFQSLREYNPQTPDELKPYRTSGRKQIGQNSMNPKQRLDFTSSSLPHSFGLLNKPTYQVKDSIPNEDPSSLQQIINNIKEERYSSNKLQPIGKTIDRQYFVPEETKSHNFRYGAPTKANEKDAKDLITQAQDANQQIKKEQPYEPLFKPSYRLDIGEQLKRHYNTETFDQDRKFGVPYVIQPSEIKYIVSNMGAQENLMKSKIINKRQDLHQAIEHKHLGQSKASTILSETGRRQFGSTSLAQSTPNLHFLQSPIQECLNYKNMTSANFDQPDLGKSTVQGLRNIPKPGDEKRMYGVPTIRSDAVPPRNLSIGNLKNYGTEHDAFKLLRPYKYASLGLSEEDFSKPRTRDEIKDLMGKIGIKYNIGKIFGIFQEAQRMEGSSETNKVSLGTFVEAMQLLDSVQ